MKYLSRRDIQIIELNILKKIHSICEKNKLRYSLGGGTLLGAVRHKGFIPWDDDIDIMMPRIDYEKFISFFEKQNDSSDIELHEYKTYPEFPYPYAKVVNKNTIIKNQLVETGVFVDIFPIDGFPANEFVSKIKIKCSTLLWSLRTFKYHGESYFDKNTKFIYLWRLASRLFSVKQLEKTYIKLLSAHKYETSSYVGVISGGVYGLDERMRRKYFDKTIKLKFEDSLFYCIKGYDEYLKQHYNNYMELPPKDKRISHELKAYKIDD